ncbi:hypothetical protein ACFP81_04485 [Deinococcus lacus]|uniref:Uncharacterized protein n=1 Tax=Deinococcus lacus TaxID=392561 RepID=A0ABW1YB17_9DEIO
MPDFAALAAQVPLALSRRAPLPAAGTTFFRALHTTETGGLLALDQAGDAGVLSLYRPLSPEQEAALLAHLVPVLAEWGLAALYLKRRPPKRGTWRMCSGSGSLPQSRCGARPAQKL